MRRQDLVRAWQALCTVGAGCCISEAAKGPGLLVPVHEKRLLRSDRHLLMRVWKSPPHKWLAYWWAAAATPSVPTLRRS